MIMIYFVTMLKKYMERIMTENNEHQAVTRGIKYWGLRGMPSASPAGKVLIG